MTVVISCIGAGVLHAQTSAPAGGVQFWPLIVTPLLSGVVAITGAFIAIRFDAKKAANQELIKKRISVYDTVAPKINELLCFFLSHGPWKSLTPPLMIQRKRELDQAMYIYGPLFSQAAVESYNIFIHLCFKTFVGVGRDACLRANHNRLRSEWAEDWKPEWDNHFAPPAETTKNQEIMRGYDSLLMLLAAEIGVRQHPVHTKSRRHRWRHKIMHKS